MRMAKKPNASLWWKLSWQLSLVITAVVATVIVGLCIYGATVLSPNIAAENRIGAVVAKAVDRDPQGRLQLRDTPELRALKAQNSRLWYVVATPAGTSVSYGVIPAPYAGLAHLAHLFQDADIRGAAGTTDVASVESVETTVGEVRILFGGFTDKGWPVLALLAGTYPIYVSMLAVALPAIFLPFPGLSAGRSQASAMSPMQHRKSSRGAGKHAFRSILFPAKSRPWWSHSTKHWNGLRRSSGSAAAS